MPLVHMLQTDTTFTYVLHGGVDPKLWQVAIKDGRIVFEVDVPHPTKAEPEGMQHIEWSTKLTRYVDPDAKFEVIPGDFFEYKGDNEQMKGHHDGGKVSVVFPKRATPRVAAGA
jgi:hypothetical protein